MKLAMGLVLTERDWAAHAAAYSKPNLPKFEWFAIGRDGRLFHGRNPLTKVDIAEIASPGVTHILDLRQAEEWSGIDRLGTDALRALPDARIERLNVPVADALEPGPREFSVAAMFLDYVHDRPDTRIYIHCRLGRERTAAVLGAWWARRNGLSFDDAVARLNADGARLVPLPGQRAAAKSWLANR